MLWYIGDDMALKVFFGLCLFVGMLYTGYVFAGESGNFELLIRAKAEKEFNDKVIAGDLVVIESLVDIFDPSLTYEQNVEVLRICALNNERSVNLRVESDKLAYDLLRSDRLYRYLVIGFQKAGLHLLSIIERNYAEDKLQIIDDGANTAISRMRSKPKEFFAKFFKNQAAYFILVAVALFVCIAYVKQKRKV